MTETVTLSDVKHLAGELKVNFTDNGDSFDLDTPERAIFQMHGTYWQSQASLDAAYGALARYRARLRRYDGLQTGEG